MSNWSYQTRFRPGHFRSPAKRARAFSLSTTVRGVRPYGFGPGLSEWIELMRPAPALRPEVLGLSLDSPLAFSADKSGNERALVALARFGVGLIEVGPVALEQAVRVDTPDHLAVGLLRELLRAAGALPTRVLARLSHKPGAGSHEAADERAAVIDELAPYVDGFSLTPPPSEWDMWAWAAHIARVQAAATANARPVFAGVRVDDLALAESQFESAYAVGVRGLLICDGLRQTPDPVETATNTVFRTLERKDDACLGSPALSGAPASAAGRRLGPATLEPARALIKRLRTRYGERGVAVIAAAGATEPGHALDLFAAGADVCALDTDRGYWH